MPRRAQAGHQDSRAHGCAVAVHTAAFATTTVVIAMLVYEVLGLGLLRRMWINLDALWAGALLAAGPVTLAL